MTTSAEEQQGQSTQLLQRFGQSPEVFRGWEVGRFDTVDLPTQKTGISYQLWDGNMT